MSERFVTPRVAAEHLGYAPESDSRRDPQMRAFMALADRHLRGQKHHIGGRLLFRLSEIDAKVRQMRETTAGEEPAIDPKYSDAQQLAVRVARGESIPGRVRRFPRAVGGRA